VPSQKILDNYLNYLKIALLGKKRFRMNALCCANYELTKYLSNTILYLDLQKKKDIVLAVYNNEKQIITI
jgi:hypothetical protein